LNYRLNVVELYVPPLRDRHEDVTDLTAAFLREYAKEFSKPIWASPLMLNGGWLMPSGTVTSANSATRSNARSCCARGTC